MAANDAVSMNVAENRQNVPMAIQENRAAVPMTVAEGGVTPGGLNRKADKVTGAAAGNLAGLDSTGNLTDSGKAPEDFLEAPASAGTQGQVLTADGEGGASWQDPTGGDPTEIIDDEAGSGDTDKVWSADKSHALLTEINSRYTKPNTGIPASDMAQGVQTSLGLADSAYQKPGTGIPASDLANGVIPSVPVQDVQMNGTSILDAQGVANVPVASASTEGVVKVDAANGVGISNSTNKLIIATASAAVIKNGTNQYTPITPSNQNASVFYALAKLAGADMASSSNPVGTFTDDALVKIQKMLGIYEAPWELIREDTVTNATEADIEITVDGDGNPFELTDVRMVLESPQQSTVFIKGDYGRIRLVYGISSTEYYSLYIGAYTQNADASKRYSFIQLDQNNGMIVKTQAPNNTSGSLTVPLQTVSQINGMFEIPDNKRIFQKVIITKVTGTLHYKLYGRRKWN